MNSFINLISKWIVYFANYAFSLNQEANSIWLRKHLPFSYPGTNFTALLSINLECTYIFFYFIIFNILNCFYYNYNFQVHFNHRIEFGMLANIFARIQSLNRALQFSETPPCYRKVNKISNSTKWKTRSCFECSCNQTMKIKLTMSYEAIHLLRLCNGLFTWHSRLLYCATFLATSKCWI